MQRGPTGSELVAFGFAGAVAAAVAWVVLFYAAAYALGAAAARVGVAWDAGVEVAAFALGRVADAVGRVRAVSDLRAYVAGGAA